MNPILSKNLEIWGIYYSHNLCSIVIYGNNNQGK